MMPDATDNTVYYSLSRRTLGFSLNNLASQFKTQKPPNRRAPGVYIHIHHHSKPTPCHSRLHFVCFDERFNTNGLLSPLYRPHGRHRRRRSSGTANYYSIESLQIE